MEGPNGRSFITDQYAKLAHGKAERDFPFIACSDSSFTEVCIETMSSKLAIDDFIGRVQSLPQDLDSRGLQDRYPDQGCR